MPIGFVCDHTEILFDIDVQARGRARVSATLRRTESLNTSPTFIAMLEDLVRASIGVMIEQSCGPRAIRFDLQDVREDLESSIRTREAAS